MSSAVSVDTMFTSALASGRHILAPADTTISNEIWSWSAAKAGLIAAAASTDAMRLDLSGYWIISLSSLGPRRGPGFNGERVNGLSYEMISVIGNCVTIVVRELRY